MKSLNLILFRYLFLFLLFAAFLLLLFVPIYQYVAGFTFRNELAYLSGKMRQGITRVDAVVTALNNLVVATTRDSRFVQLKYASRTASGASDGMRIALSPHALTELRDTLNITILSHPLLADVGIIFADGAVITRQSIFYYPTPVSFYGQMLQCDDLSREEWLHLLTSASGSPFLPERAYTAAYYGAYNAVTFVSHWSYADFPDKNILFAAIPVEGIMQLIADTDVITQGYIKLYDTRGSILFSRGLKENNADNNETFHILANQSIAAPLRYEIGVPDSLIQQKMRPVKARMILFACITVVFILLMSLVFAWHGSMPERTFLKRIGSTRLIRPHNENVFIGMKQLYSELAENISTLNSQLESSLDVIENQTHLIRAHIIDRIRQALKLGDEAAAYTILQDCSTTLPKPELPLIADIVAGMLVAMIQELKAEYPELLADVETPDYAPCTQAELFEQRFPACFARICECIHDSREKDISDFAREVLDYINEHLYDPNLYITEVSERFSISPPTLQKLVKQSSGQTFLVYVEKRRLAHAYELLVGRHSIKETAGICGFSNASSFSRAFKRSYGFSPSRLLNSPAQKENAENRSKIFSK